MEAELIRRFEEEGIFRREREFVVEAILRIGSLLIVAILSNYLGNIAAIFAAIHLFAFVYVYLEALYEDIPFLFLDIGFALVLRFEICRCAVALLL